MVFVKVVVNNKELRRLRVSDSRLDNSYRALIEALRPSSVTIPSSLSSSFLTVATTNKWGQSNATPAGASPATMNRRLKEWQLEYQDEEGDRITVTSDVELREAIRVATEAKRTLRLFAWSVNEVGRAAALASRNQPMLDWDDDDYDDLEDEEEPGTSREGQPSPHVSVLESKRQMVIPPPESKSAPSVNDASSSSPSITPSSSSSSGIGAELKQHQLDSNNNASGSESKRTNRSLSMASIGLEEESPFDPLVRSHVRRTLQMFHDYYAGMVNEHRTEQGRMKAALAARIQKESKGANGAAAEGELNMVEAHMVAMKELNDRFQDSVTVLLDRYERHMSSLPACPFLLPIVVTLYVCPPPPSTPEVNLEGVTPPPLLVFEQVSLRPTDTIASLRRLFATKISDSGLPGAKILDTARILLHRPIRSRHERAPTEPIKKSFTERLFGKKKVDPHHREIQAQAGRERSPSIDRKKSPPPVGIPPAVGNNSPAASPAAAAAGPHTVDRLTYEPIWYDDESVCIGDLPLPWGSHVTLQGVVVETRTPSLSRVVSPVSPASSSLLPSVSVKLSSAILPPISLSVSAPMMIVNAMTPSSPPAAPVNAKKSSIINAGSPPPLSISSSLSSSLGSSPSSLGPSSILAAVSSSSSSSGVPPFSVTTSSMVASSSLMSPPPRVPTPLEAPHHLLSGAAVAQPVAPSVTPASQSLVNSGNNGVPYSLMFSPIPLSRDYATHKQVAMERMVAAVNNGDVAAFQSAIEDGADVHSILPGGLGYTVLHRAAAMGHLGIVHYLLSPACAHLRVSLNQQDIQGWTPLMRAAACKTSSSCDIVRVLVERRANAHIRNQAGQNALGIAALSNNILAIDILTTRGVRNGGNGSNKNGGVGEQKEGEKNLNDDDIEEKAALGNGVVSGGAMGGNVSPIAAAVVAATRDGGPVWQSLLTRELSATHAAGVPLALSSSPHAHAASHGSAPPSPALGPALLVPAAPTPAPLKIPTVSTTATALLPSSPPSLSSSASSSLSSGAGVLHNVLHSEHKDDDFEEVGDDSAWAMNGQPLSRRGSIGGDRALSLSSSSSSSHHHVHDPAGGSSSPISLVQRLFDRTPVYGVPHNIGGSVAVEGMPLTSVGKSHSRSGSSAASSAPININHNNNHHHSHHHDELP